MDTENRRGACIEALEKAPNIELDGRNGKYEITGDPKTDRKSIVKFLKSIKGKEFHNAGIPESVKISERGIKKLTNYGMKEEIYKKLVAHIPELIDKSVPFGEANRKVDHHYNSFYDLVAGVVVENKPYTVRSVIGKDYKGAWYYTFFITPIEKGELIRTIRYTKAAAGKFASKIKDTVLLKLLQAPSQSRFASPPAKNKDTGQ